MTSPTSMFFASSAVAPHLRESVDYAEDSGAIGYWGEQPPDLVTAANCMESFMDLKQYCSTSAFTEPPEGELNTPVVDFAKEPNFDIPSRTVPGNDSADYSWRLNDTTEFSENCDTEGYKETDESNTPAEEMDVIISDNNNNNDDNNNNNVRSDYTASEYTQLNPVHYAHDVTFGNTIMPVFTKSELAGTETYTATTAGGEVYLTVDREEVVPPVAEEVIVKNEGWLSPLSRTVKSESNCGTDGVGGVHGRSRRPLGLKVELPVPSVTPAALALQVTPGTGSGDLFQSVPQDFDLMKFLLEDGMPEEVPDPLATLCRDSWVPQSGSVRTAPTAQEAATLADREHFTTSTDIGEPGGTREADTRQQDSSGQYESADSRDTEEHQEKLQLVIRKTNSPDGRDSPSYAVVQRPQRAASRRVLQAIKEELQDNYEDDDDFRDGNFRDDDDDEYGAESSDGQRSAGGRKRRAPRGTRREKSRDEPPRQRRRTVSTSSNDDTPICRRYRELRDKNNEASRRSRENRKMREAEMQEQRERLERENARLKVRAEELERLVDALRKALVAAVSTSAGRRGSAGAAAED